MHPFIEAEKQRRHRRQTRRCELLKVSRSAYYATPHRPSRSPRGRDDAELTEQITGVHDRRPSGTYGAPRVHADLAGQGRRHGRKRVARLMRAAGLRGGHRRRRHADHHPRPGRRRPGRT